MMDGDVIHETGRHYVVCVRDARRPKGSLLYCVRRQGEVLDKTLARLSGAGARDRAIEHANRLEQCERRRA